MPSPSASTDATGALTRGVAEYVAGLTLGGDLAFEKCFDEWPVPEDMATYPSFAAYTNDSDGTYEAASLSTMVNPRRYPDGTYEASSAELAIEIMCEVWATNPEERTLLVALLEQAFSPVDWMYGFRLELPHYYNQRASFEPARIVRLGAAQEALQGFVNARMTLRAVVPVTRVLPFAEGKPQARVSVSPGALEIPPGSVVGE